MKLTLDEHRRLGERLKETKELLQELFVQVGPRSSREFRAARRALKAVDNLKDCMDSAVWRDYPKLGAEDKASIYYGMSQAWLARQEKKGAIESGVVK